MKILNWIRRVFRWLRFWKKPKPDSGSLTEETKTFYDVELLRYAKAMDPVKMFGGTHCNQPHGGVTVSFKKYTPLADQILRSTDGTALPPVKAEQHPCETCLRWPECEGVDQECPMRK